MKLIIDSRELANMLDEVGVTEDVKKKVAGLIVSLSQTPIMTKAIEEIIESKVTKRVDERVTMAIDTALSVKRDSWGGKLVVDGWAFGILRSKLEEEVKGMTVRGMINNHMEDYTKAYTADHSDAQMNALLEQAKKAIEETITKEYVAGVINKVADDEFRKMVQTEVQAALRKIITNQDQGEEKI